MDKRNWKFFLANLANLHLSRRDLKFFDFFSRWFEEKNFPPKFDRKKNNWHSSLDSQEFSSSRIIKLSHKKEMSLRKNSGDTPNLEFYEFFQALGKFCFSEKFKLCMENL